MTPGKSPALTPEEVAVALRLVKAGLPVPNHSASRNGDLIFAKLDKGVGLYVEGDRNYDPETRLMFVVIRVEGTPVLLPDVRDAMLAGWLLGKVEQVLGEPVDILSYDADPDFFRWAVVPRSNRERPEYRYESRIDALAAAWEGALQATKRSPE